MVRTALLLSLCATAPALAQSCDAAATPLQVLLIDEQDRPVPAALIEVDSYRSGTDSSGKITFCVPLGKMRIATVTATGYVPTSLPAYLLASPSFKLQRIATSVQLNFGRITVMVMDITGAVIPDATVELKNEAATFATYRTDRNGIVDVPDVQSRQTRIAVSAQGFASINVPVHSQVLFIRLDMGDNGGCNICVTMEPPQFTVEPTVIASLVPVPYPDLQPPTIYLRYPLRHKR